MVHFSKLISSEPCLQNIDFSDDPKIHTEIKTKMEQILEAHMIAESKLERLKQEIAGVSLKTLYLTFLPDLKPKNKVFDMKNSQENFHPNFEAREEAKESILASKIDMDRWIDYFEAQNLNLSEIMIKKLFEYYDGNEDGCVTYAEFVEELLPRIQDREM